MEIKKKFTEKQEQAIELLARKEVDNYSMESIADCVGVTRKCLYDWLKDINFKRAVNKRALECLVDYAPLMLKCAEDFLKSNDSKLKVKGVDLVIRSLDAQEKAIEEENNKKVTEADIEEFLRGVGL